MAIKFLNSIDLNYNRLEKTAIQTGTSDPSTGDEVAGQLFYNSTGSGALKYYNGSGAWVNVLDNSNLSDEAVQDIVGAMFTSNTETRISATYDDSDGTIDLVVNDMTANDNTTYGISCADGGSTDEEKIRLTSSAGATDDIVLKAGTGLSIARDTDKITFTNTVTNSDTTYGAGSGISLSSTTFSVAAGTGLTQEDSGLALSHLGLESLSDPNADRIFFWDDSAGASKFLTVGSNLSISDTTINATNTEYDAMTTTTLGLGKLRYATGSTPAAVAQTATANRTYGVTEDSSGRLVVNVGWEQRGANNW